MKEPYTILLVEDDDDLRDALAFAIQALGYRVETASNGREALQRLENGLRPALILLDLLMPVMNGWDFCILRRDDPRFAGVPVVLLSGSQHTERHAGVLGARAFLAKPVELSRLADLLSLSLKSA